MPTDNTGEILGTLLAIAWLAPLVGFAIEVFGRYWGSRTSRAAAYLAIGCIALGFCTSLAALVTWGEQTDWAVFKDHGSAHHASSQGHGATPGKGTLAANVSGGQAMASVRDNVLAADDAEEHAPGAAGAGEHPAGGHAALTNHPQSYTGTFYTLARFGKLRLSIDYYIDSLTLVMFVMVTLVATCIHIFAVGYMSDELTEDHVDHAVHLLSGGHLHRPGRFYQFFSYMSLFCFSMLGLVIAGNVFMVFVFWELVGICSYLLIGFYVERKLASTAANKAFIVNRVGDFGFLIGMMVIWTWFGTFQFSTHEVNGAVQPGLFQMVRGNDGKLDVDSSAGLVYFRGSEGERLVDPGTGQPLGIPYMLLVVVGLGVFAGCVGKSAQFPLQTWLPDAMEGPTPVSALVHSATMVAAGVYLAGRFFPLFLPEVLLTIAYVGCITLFVAATIAVVATDIKRVLAYSTISQLGYMMLAIGVAGWAAGLFHLITHAFFKSLMFLASGSVILGCHHEQEMPRMGGLRKKMPITTWTMFVGVVAISGLAIPGITVLGEHLAFSGYHSKDAIVATALAFTNKNPGHFVLFLVPLITAGITAFYMFRLWFYTFWGKPRDQDLHDHVHESPWVITGPLIVLALFAAGVAIGGEEGTLFKLIAHSEPADVAAGTIGATTAVITLPAHQDVADVHAEAGTYALMAAFLGFVIAFLLYGRRVIDPAEIKRHFAGVHNFLVEKWQFDVLYDVMFVKPVHVVARWCAWIDRWVLDGILHGASRMTVDVSRWDRRFDEGIIDGLVNLIGDVIFGFGRALRAVQTGSLRQYVMFIAVGVLAMFVLLFVLFPL